MKKIAESVLALLNKDEAAIKAAMIKSDNGISVYPDSVHKLGNAAVMMARDEEKRFIIVVADCCKDMPCGFEGETSQLADGGVALVGALTAENAAALRKHFPWCAPRSLRNERTTIGCGDRLGLASFGHIKAARKVRLIRFSPSSPCANLP